MIRNTILFVATVIVSFTLRALVQDSRSLRQVDRGQTASRVVSCEGAMMR
jgi:hypothetical protein